jgi:hypothetical protein
MIGIRKRLGVWEVIKKIGLRKKIRKIGLRKKIRVLIVGYYKGIRY